MVENPKHNQEGDLHAQSVNSSSKADQWKDKMSKLELAQLNRFCGDTIRRYQQLQVVTTGNQ